MHRNDRDNPDQVDVADHLSGTIQLTAKDLITAQRFHFSRSLMTLKPWLRMAVIWGGASLAFVIFIAIVSGPSRIGATLPGFMLVIPPVALGTFLAVYLLALPRNARRAFSNQKSLRIPVRYTIADDALLLESEAGSVRLAWQDIHMIRENDSLLMLYEWEEFYRPLPKRCLPEDHLEVLRERADGRHAIKS